MRNASRATLVALGLASTLALGACGPEQTAAGGGASESKTSSSTASEYSTSSDNSSSDSPSSSASPSSKGTSSSGSAASENSGPTGARPDAPETIKVPSSEVLKSAKVVMAGGYKASKDSGYAKLYSVWKVDGTGPGEATIQYELLDSAGKVLETTEDKINVGSGTGMTKVSNKISKAPAGAKKVRMKITKVTEDENSHDISVSNVKVTKDGHEGRWPLITGTFKAPEDIGPVGFSAVCHDSTGRVVVGNGLPTVTGAKSGDFRVKLGAAPEHWEPSSCFVGQTG